jgi:hypothetical protein
MSELRDIERAIGRVEKAVKESRGAVVAAFWGLIIYMIVSLMIDAAWHSRWRYAVRFGVNANAVRVEKKPHDCDFMAAPIGIKYCDYDPQVSFIRWGRSQTTGDPVISYDDGKTWTVFTPDANVTVPQSNTIKEVLVGWQKKED